MPRYSTVLPISGSNVDEPRCDIITEPIEYSTWPSGKVVLWARKETHHLLLYTFEEINQGCCECVTLSASKDKPTNQAAVESASTVVEWEDKCQYWLECSCFQPLGCLVSALALIIYYIIYITN